MKALKIGINSAELVEISSKEITGGGFGFVYESKDVCMLVGDRNAEQHGAAQNPLASLLARRQTYGDAYILGVCRNSAGFRELCDVPDSYVRHLLK